MEMLGLVSLMGQRLPDALGEFLAELRVQSKASAEYHSQVDALLADLPAQIAEGVDPAAIAKSMSEAFRQQLAATGLQDTAALLKAGPPARLRVLPLMPPQASNPPHKRSSTISSETARLVAAARQVEQHNERLIVQQRANGWMLEVLVALTLFLIGGICGIVLEKRQTTDLLSNIGAQVERVQTPAPATPIVEVPRKNRKQGL
jgi:hypothetical protein